MLALIIVLIDVGILFDDFLLQSFIIDWSSFVRRTILLNNLFLKGKLRKIKSNVELPLGWKLIHQFLAGGEQVELLLQLSHWKGKGNE